MLAKQISDFNSKSDDRAIIQLALYAGGFPATISTLPAPSAVSGLVYKITDLNNIRVWSDGSIWRPLGVQILGSQAITVSSTGTLNEVSLTSLTIPGGLLHANSQLRLTALVGFTSNANSKTLRVRLGGISGSLIFSNSYTTNSSSIEIQRRITFKNSVSSQQTYPNNAAGPFGPTGTAGPNNISLNFANAQDLVISSQLATASDSGNLYNSILEWLA